MTCLERRPDLLDNQLGPTGHVKQHLGFKGNRNRVVLSQQQGSDPITKRSTARITAKRDRESLRLNPFREPGNLRGLTATIWAIKREEQTTIRRNLVNPGANLAMHMCVFHPRQGEPVAIREAVCLTGGGGQCGGDRQNLISDPDIGLGEELADLRMVQQRHGF